MAEIIDADAYVLVDGDDTYPADAAPAMLEELARADLDMLGPGPACRRTNRGRSARFIIAATRSSPRW